MSTVTFHPARLHGSAAVPPAKSEAHRALLLATLGRGECRLHGFPPPLCDDTQAMVNGITALGAKVEAEGDTLRVTPAPPVNKELPPARFHVQACAAALRMLIPVFWVRGQAAEITMEAGLFERPLDAFQPLARRIGGSLDMVPATEGAYAQVTLSGKMNAGEYEVDGSLSSQYASGLLIALGHATDASGKPAPSRLTLTKPIVSRPYLDMTLGQMERFGRSYQEKEEGVFTVTPMERKNPGDAHISGDWSQAAVLLCVNAMGGGVMLRGVGTEGAGTASLQGDAEILLILRRMGLSAYKTQGELYVTNPSRPGLMPLTVDCENIPDLAPILALTCTQARGTSVLTGVKRLRAKECDRLKATQEILTRLGAKVEVAEDTLTIHGPAKLRGGLTEDSRGDHRMVMLLAAGALIADAPITVTGAEAIDKSWPGFLETLKALGGEVS